MDQAELTHIAPTHGNAETVLEDVLLLSPLTVFLGELISVLSSFTQGNPSMNVVKFVRRET